MLEHQVADQSMVLEQGDYDYLPNELVFVVGADGMKSGIITAGTASGCYEVQVHGSEEKKVVAKQYLRKLSLLGHVIYQPNVSCAMLRSVIDCYSNMVPMFESPCVQSCIISPEKKIIVVGDLHGCFDSLVYCFKEWYQHGIISKELVLDPEYIVVFTGDYIDRGLHSIEVLYALTMLKIRNPASVFLICGNHERMSLKEPGDFYDEWLVEFGDGDFALETWASLLKMFASMPNAVVLGHKIKSLYDCILFSHAGIEIIDNFLGCIIKRHDEQKGIGSVICHSVDGLAEYNGFNWLDFYAQGPTYPTLVRDNTARGGGLYAWSHHFLSDYLEKDQSSCGDSKPYSYVLRALCRGHQHMEGGITRLLERENAHGQHWMRLADRQEYPIRRGDVFTFFSASDMLPLGRLRHYAYGVISIRNNDWVLVPHIQEWFLACTADH
jgi:hypothetical protein